MKILFLLLFTTLSLFSWKMESDSITVNANTDDVVTHVTFRQSYDVVPLVFTLPEQGTDPVALRVANVTLNGFDIYSTEPEGSDGTHDEMTNIPYIAIEPSSVAEPHVLANGTKIIASTIETKSYQGKFLSSTSWESVSLSGLTQTPIVLAQVQSRNNESSSTILSSTVSTPWLTTAIKQVSSSGFSIALERVETTNGSVTNSEKIAYLVMESGLNGSDHTLFSNSSQTVNYETILSSGFIKGVDNSSTGFNISFSQKYTNPIVMATSNSRNGNNGGWLVRHSLSSDSISVCIQEDASRDTESNHVTEDAGIVLFSEPFDVQFGAEITLDKSSLTIYDPINLENNPKAIPGAMLKYLISATNEGQGATDVDTIVLSDNVPSNMKLCVNTVSRCKERLFVDGTVSSGLSLNSVLYSNNNGSDFTYTPTADTEGFDSDVTDIKIKLDGSFKESDGMDNPSFTIEFYMGVQ